MRIKDFLPRGLMGRSVLIVLIPILLLQIITVYVFFDRHWNRITSRLSYAVAGEIAVIAQATEDDDNPKNLERLIGYTAQNLDLLISYQPQETLAAQADPVQANNLWDALVANLLKSKLEGALRRPFRLHVDLENKWVHVGVQLQEGVLSVSFPQSRLYSSSGYIFLLWMFGISLVLVILAMIFMRNQIRPILRLAVAAERFGKGRDVPTFRPQGAREVRQAAQAFIDMQRRIKRQVEQRTAMLAGVSHDLRTPLTRLKLQLAMMPAGQDVDLMKGDIAEMERMIAGYLDFVRGEGDEIPVAMNIGEIMSSVVESARRQGLIVNYEGAGAETVLMLRPLAMERALGNILGNAAKYAKAAQVALFVNDGRLHIQVDDDGPGIPPDAYDDVFRPFFRLDPSRNPETGGVGLGLPIAADIIHSHGGSISLSASPLGGLRVLVRLPL
ncbi:MAG: ATP-binding protein [Alphaproteobacteria bacterium]|nr:ATP-binding protein [Alphaproteobacteria bacterium]